MNNAIPSVSHSYSGIPSYLATYIDASVLTALQIVESKVNRNFLKEIIYTLSEEDSKKIVELIVNNIQADREERSKKGSFKLLESIETEILEHFIQEAI